MADTGYTQEVIGKNEETPLLCPGRRVRYRGKMDQSDPGMDIEPDYPVGPTEDDSSLQGNNNHDYYRKHHRMDSDFSDRPSMFGGVDDDHYRLQEQYHKALQDITPGGTMIRQRTSRKSSRRQELDFQFEAWTEDEATMLPSQRFQKHSRQKSLKERFEELQEIHQMEDKEKAQSLRNQMNRFAQMDGSSRFASIVRKQREETTLSRMKNLTQDKHVGRFRRQVKEVFQYLTIWLGTFKEIEGSFGTAIMTYFKFIKWLMFLNFYMMLIMFFVTTFVHLLPSHDEYTCNSLGNGSLACETSLRCTQNYKEYIANTTHDEDVLEKVLDILQGTGWMERTILFYGVYHNKTVTLHRDGHEYNMALAYLIAVGVCFIISFLLLVKNAAKSVKVTLGMENAVAKYCNKVFAGWDFCIKKTKGAGVRHKNITVDITADLAEQRRKARLTSLTTSDRAKIYIIRILVNLLVFGLLAGAGYLIIFTTSKMLELQKGDLSDIELLLVQYLPYMTITALNLILPQVFIKLVKWEDYFHEFEIKITLVRSILLRLASPIVLIIILYQSLIGSDDESFVKVCGNSKFEREDSKDFKGLVKCWETTVGQQLYKLVLLDLIVETGIVIFVQTPRSLLYKKFGNVKLIQLMGPQEFHLSVNVVDIIYSQSICWMGLFFCPLLPFITFLKCFLFFYVKKFTLIFNCQSEERPPRTSRSNSLFMTVLLISFFLTATPLCYMIGKIPPSQSCGPFRLYDSDYVIFDTISNTVLSWPKEAFQIFNFIARTGFLVLLIVLLVLLMYYYWVLGSGYKKTEKILQNQLILEGKDKKFLLGRLLDLKTSEEINENEAITLARPPSSSSDQARIAGM